MDAAQFADYASVGALEPYGDRVSNPGDFYESLRTAFTYDGKLYCAPKDFSTLALQINTDLWTRAGLTDADVPTTWEQLTAAAQKIKAKGQVPLAIGDTGTGSAPSWCRTAAGW
ncbi:extracellular solute-binding protein [Micromonospora sp. M12]